jgi:hypothetical protein
MKNKIIQIIGIICIFLSFPSIVQAQKQGQELIEAHFDFLVILVNLGVA